MATIKLTKIRQERFTKRCAIEFAAEGKTYIGISVNFSLSGLFIRSRVLLAPGTVIELSVHLPDGSISKLKGRVVRVLTISGDRAFSLDGGMGVMLLARDHSFQRFIDSHLSTQRSDTKETEPGISTRMALCGEVEEKKG